MQKQPLPLPAQKDGRSCIKTVLGVVGAAHTISACFGGLLSLKDATGAPLVSTLIVAMMAERPGNSQLRVMNQLYPPTACPTTGVLSSNNNPYNYDELERSARHLAGPMLFLGQGPISKMMASRTSGVSK